MLWSWLPCSGSPYRLRPCLRLLLINLGGEILKCEGADRGKVTPMRMQRACNYSPHSIFDYCLSYTRCGQGAGPRDELADDGKRQTKPFALALPPTTNSKFQIVSNCMSRECGEERLDGTSPWETEEGPGPGINPGHTVLNTLWQPTFQFLWEEKEKEKQMCPYALNDVVPTAATQP